MSIKTTIKTIAFILMVQLISGNLIARIIISETDKKTRPGDGNDKYDPKTKQGESLKGYFYRVYGDKRVLAKNIKFKGPFKRKKVKKFLKKCQKKDGYIAEVSTRVQEKNTIEAEYGNSNVFIHHITLKTKANCLVHDRIIANQTWTAVYLDSDNITNGANLYVDYVDCDADDRAYLEVGEYSIHYDQNPQCRANLFDLAGS